MIIFCDFKPPALYNSLHELVRMAFPDVQIVRERTADAEMQINISLAELGDSVQLRGEIVSSDRKTSSEEENELKGTFADRHNEARKMARIFTYKLLCKHLDRDINAYGILTGVRPVKLVQRFLDQGYDSSAILAKLEKEYLLDESKARLLLEVALNNRPYLLRPEEARKKISIYVGIPFCPSRCYYCSFPGAVLKDYEKDMEPFIKALTREMQAIGDYINGRGISVQSIYLGGGTPTVLSEPDMEKIFALLHEKFISQDTTEITVEAGRPDTLSLEKLQVLMDAGVNRVCVNPQSMNDATLTRIGRNHNEKGVMQSVEWVREVGIKKLNMDIIVGLPGEGIRENTYTAEKILDLRPDNITVHTLALKRGSAMAELEGKRNIADRIAEVKKGVDFFSSLLRQADYTAYYMYRQKYMKANMENIAYSLEGSFGLYNIQVIEERQTIIGMGGGAASKFVNASDWTLSSFHNPKNPQSYAESVEKLIERKFDKLEALN